MKSIFLLLLVLAAGYSRAQENCSNGKDDDGDGLIDLKDPECWCKDSLPNLNYFHNASFEDYNSCPQDPANGLGAGNVPYWFKEPLAAEIPYYNVNCPYSKYFSTRQDSFPPPLPLLYGNGYLLLSDHGDIGKGNKAYAATCLENTLKAGKKYSFECNIGFSPADANNLIFVSPYRLTLFGNPDCSVSQYTNFNSRGCPLVIDEFKPNYNWQQLGVALVYGKGNWAKVHIDFTPSRDINVLLVGPPCINMGIGYNAYYYADNFSLSEQENFAFKTVTVKNNCRGTVQLTAPSATTASLQWYSDSIAIAGATSSQYSIPENTPLTNYNVRLQFTATCVVSNTVQVSTLKQSPLTLGHDTMLCLGESLQLIANIQAVNYLWQDGSTQPLLNVTQAGTYSLKISDAFGCSDDATIKVNYDNCTNCSVFIPSAFTPNGDGVNDVFKVLTACTNINNFSLVVYNRWGEKIYQSTDVHKGWDGTYKRNSCKPEPTFTP